MKQKLITNQILNVTDNLELPLATPNKIMDPFEYFNGAMEVIDENLTPTATPANPNGNPTEQANAAKPFSTGGAYIELNGRLPKLDYSSAQQFTGKIWSFDGRPVFAMTIQIQNPIASAYSVGIPQNATIIKGDGFYRQANGTQVPFPYYHSNASFALWHILPNTRQLVLDFGSLSTAMDIIMHIEYVLD